MKRALSASAAETFVLASAEKLNAASPYVIAPLTGVDGLIVEASTPAAVLETFTKEGMTIIRA
jgi:DeoR/GlpR family transcriptional regulator of sugar metabolism